MRATERFNSLQTGKYIQRKDRITVANAMENGFNSLQTGKYIQRVIVDAAPYRAGIVSIPFKRESISKDELRQALLHIDGFQFPSNGKVYPKAKV